MFEHKKCHSYFLFSFKRNGRVQSQYVNYSTGTLENVIAVYKSDRSLRSLVNNFRFPYLYTMTASDLGFPLTLIVKSYLDVADFSVKHFKDNMPNIEWLRG